MAATSFDPVFFDRDPLFWPIAAQARAFASFEGWPSVEQYNALVAHTAKVTFRRQPGKPRGRRRREVCVRDLYDGRIVEEGWVPTRAESWHDFLNMLVWSVFPASKWQLHTRQHRAQTARLAESEGLKTLPNARTREQDALALLDEGGVVIATREGDVERVRAAFAERRTDEVRALFASGSARAVIYGHALYEGLVLGHEEGWGAGLVVGVGSVADGGAQSLVSAGAKLELDAESLVRAAAKLELDAESLVRAADGALAKALAREGSFQTPSELVRVDLPLLRVEPRGVV